MIAQLVFRKNVGIPADAVERMNALWNDGYEIKLEITQEAREGTFLTLIFHKPDDFTTNQPDDDEVDDDGDFVPPPDDVSNIPF